MQKTLTVIRYIVIIVVVALLGGVGGWYFYLRSHNATIASIIAGRGLDKPVPTNDSPLGSTAANVQAPVIPIATTSTAVPTTTVNGVRASAQLWRVDQGPVSGFSFIAPAKNAPTSTQLFFATRASGNVFDADAGQQAVTRLTNTLIPKTYEAVFAPKGGVALLRTLQGETISTLLATFATSASTSTFPQALNGPTLAPNIRALAIDPDPKSTKVFYLAPASGGVTGGFLTTLTNAKPKQLFSSPVGSWRPMIASGKIILLESPADDMPGYAYTLSETGTLSLYAGPLPGLMLVPHPSAAALLLSGSSGGQLALYVQTGKSAPIALPIQTVAEKCAWDPNSKNLIAYCAVPSKLPTSGFINAWYQGSLHTIDTLWKIDAAKGTAEQLFTPTQPIDVRDPQVDPSGHYLAFENASDMSLWVFKIVQ